MRLRALSWGKGDAVVCVVLALLLVGIDMDVVDGIGDMETVVSLAGSPLVCYC